MRWVTRVSLLFLVTISAKVHCNLIPNLSGTSNVIFVREDTPVGQHAFQINATDPDGDPLTYSIRSEEDGNNFNVDAATGDVTIRTPLDRESKELLGVVIQVSDGHYFPSKRVNVVVQDANDNAPDFIGIPYNAKAKEDVAIGTEIIKVSAEDRDTKFVNYTLSLVSSADGNNPFQISTKNGSITLRDTLSFTDKSTFYQLNVVAQDEGGWYLGEFISRSSSAFVLVTVEDVANLDPEFLNLPSSASVPEGSDLDTPVFTARARDPDTGINSPILYTIIESSADGLFKIEAATGEVKVAGALDREQHLATEGVVNLKIEAKESQVNTDGIQAVAVADLSITIEDINDEKPEFYSCVEDCVPQSTFTGNIDEHAAARLFVEGLEMTVSDKDQVENAQFHLSLEGPGKDAFSVSPPQAASSTKVQLQMKDPALVDYEKTPNITVTVIAVDTKDDTFRSTATVTITINDINDNAPTFANATEHLTVRENSPAGTEIATITATDPDTEDVGNIEYSLRPESIRQVFAVDPKTGRITVQENAKLDREKESEYEFTLQAKDMANNLGSCSLTVTLEDENDETPTILRNPYIAFVNEGAIEDLGVRIEASDNDEPNTDNSKIEYEIVDGPFSDNFTIDKDTGVLTMAQALDREALDPKLNGVIELNVTAFDKGTPPLGTSTIVRITVEDINDNVPHFQEADYSFEVSEGDQGAYINSVLARDLDQTQRFNRISFNILGSSGTFSVFSVPVPDNAGYWGNISVDQDLALDYETQKQYSFRVQARDLEDKTDTANVVVKVLDVNDETPIIKPGQILTVSENTKGDTVIGRIQGEDEDTKYELEFQLLSTECPCFESGECEEEWFLVETSGEVKVHPKYVVDYETCQEMILNVRVTDVLTEQGKNSSDGKITIKIEDENDNAPEFIQVQPNFVALAESTVKDTSVASVSATDRDSGDNTLMNFNVTAVKFIHTTNQTESLTIIFRAEDQPQTTSSRSAIIRSMVSLQPEWQGQYVVTVQVTDKGGLSSASNVVIFTVDKSYRVSLDFKASVDAVTDSESETKWALESITGTNVHFVEVYDSTDQNPLSGSVRSTVMTTVESYFVYPNGTALRYENVLSMLNAHRNTEWYELLEQNGLTAVSEGVEDPQGEGNLQLYILLGVMGGLIIMLVVMTTLLVFTRVNYNRKLKAAKAMNSTMNMPDNQRSGPVVPGTNKYTKEGANPVLNLNIDTATDLGFDEDDSNADRASLNSLDYNFDANPSEKDTMPMMVIEEEDEENGAPSSYYEPLDAALAQRGKRKRGDSPTLTFDNPSLSTTDL